MDERLRGRAIRLASAACRIRCVDFGTQGCFEHLLRLAGAAGLHAVCRRVQSPQSKVQGLLCFGAAAVRARSDVQTHDGDAAVRAIAAGLLAAEAARSSGVRVRDSRFGFRKNPVLCAVGGFVHRHLPGPASRRRGGLAEHGSDGLPLGERAGGLRGLLRKNVLAVPARRLLFDVCNPSANVARSGCGFDFYFRGCLVRTPARSVSGWSAGCGFWGRWCRSSAWCRSALRRWPIVTRIFHPSGFSWRWRLAFVTSWSGSIGLKRPLCQPSERCWPPV